MIGWQELHDDGMKKKKEERRKKEKERRKREKGGLVGMSGFLGPDWFRERERGACTVAERR